MVQCRAGCADIWVSAWMFIPHCFRSAASRCLGTASYPCCALVRTGEGSGQARPCFIWHFFCFFWQYPVSANPKSCAFPAFPPWYFCLYFLSPFPGIWFLNPSQNPVPNKNFEQWYFPTFLFCRMCRKSCIFIRVPFKPSEHFMNNLIHANRTNVFPIDPARPLLLSLPYQ